MPTITARLRSTSAWVSCRGPLCTLPCSGLRNPLTKPSHLATHGLPCPPQIVPDRPCPLHDGGRDRRLFRGQRLYRQILPERPPGAGPGDHRPHLGAGAIEAGASRRREAGIPASVRPGRPRHARGAGTLSARLCQPPCSDPDQPAAVKRRAAETPQVCLIFCRLLQSISKNPRFQLQNLLLRCTGHSKSRGTSSQRFYAGMRWDREGLLFLSSGNAMAAPKKSVVKEQGQDRDDAPPPEFTREQELAALRDMLLIRRFEEKAGQLYGMGAIGGFCHLYIGQEAVVVGMQMALKKGDQVISGYRDHGHMLATGMEAKGVMAELTGRRGGYSKGKGGSMHMFSKAEHFYGGHGIVGAQVSLGTGLAIANRYRGNDSVSLAYFGDGASNQGQVYESFNMAELWKLPVIYVIENNRYSMGTSVTRASAQTDFSKRGISFNIPGEQVDGMDVRSVFGAAQRALEFARSGQGPYILE